MVELMVGLVIALIGMIVIFQVFAVSEEYKRRTTGGSDAIQSANFSLYQLERQLSWAGSGLAHMPNLWGCLVRMRRAGAVVLPAPAAFPVPFDAINQQVRMAPVLIHDGGGASPDVVLAIGGSNDSVNTPVAVSGPAPSATDVALSNTLGIKQNDLLMMVEQESVGNPCPIAQASGTVVPPLLPATVGLVPNPVTFAAAGTWTGGFFGYTASSKIVNLGPAPQFMAFALGTDPATGITNVLLAYDLLNGGPPISITDNVVNLQAVYGVAATATDPKVAEWVSPGPAGPWTAAALMDGSTGAADRIAKIRAVRIVVAARNAQWERDVVTPGPVVLFADLPLTDSGGQPLRVSVTLSGVAQQYRYKVFDTVIPLRNMLIAHN
jgi:type IV pilus assembly protein PilW